jgi:hypothetical protein
LLPEYRTAEGSRFGEYNERYDVRGEDPRQKYIAQLPAL